MNTNTLSLPKRDFLSLITLSSAVIGIGALSWPMLDSLNPSADVLAMTQTEVDLSPIQKGQGIIAVWRGQPVFIRHRTPEEILLAQEVDLIQLRDPITDSERVKSDHTEWLITSAICTHLGCIPGGIKSNQLRGEFGGWFCACHGSQYDTAGRIRKGPAPRNLPLVPYDFLSDSKIVIG